MRNRLLAIGFALFASFPAFAEEDMPVPPEMAGSGGSGGGGLKVLRGLVVLGGVGLVVYGSSIRKDEPTDSTLYLGAGLLAAGLGLGAMLCPAGDSRYSATESHVVVAPVLLPEGVGAAVAVRF